MPVRPRPRLWFDTTGPSTFQQMLALMPKQLTAKVRWAEPDPRKFRLSRLSVRLQAWKRRWAA